MTFGVWLKKQSASDEDARRLEQFAEDHIQHWPFQSEDLPDYLDAVASHADDGSRRDLLLILGRTFQEWSRTEKPARKGLFAALVELIQNKLGSILLTVFGIVIAAVLALGIFDEAFLSSLAKPEQARGLITFLFAFSTIAMFILIAIATFWLDKEEVDVRFNHAKDLLTIVIGILGTILGFYFGSLPNEANPSAESAPAIVEPGQG